MKFKQQRYSVIKAGLLVCFMGGFVTGCATPTEAECDPTDDAILKTFTCQGQYKNRQKKLEEEVRIAAERAAGKEQELTELEKRRELLNQQLMSLKSDLSARQQRISALQREQGATSIELAELQEKWEKVKRETDNLEARQSQVHAAAQFNEFDEQLAELRQEEAELEQLLLDLES